VIKDELGNTPGETDLDFKKEALDVVAAANIRFNAYNIFFKYHGIGEIHNDLLYDASDLIEVTNTINSTTIFPDRSEVEMPNSYNVYVASVDTGGGAAQLFKPRYNISRGSFRDALDTSTHEIGHTLGLLHTHEFYNDNIYVLNLFTCEKVTRDITNSNYNATEAGDFVTDTAAVPNFRTQHLMELYLDKRAEGWSPEDAIIYAKNNSILYNYFENCSYLGSNWIIPINQDTNYPLTYVTYCYGRINEYGDYLDEPYDLSYEDINNLMSYKDNESCINEGILTIGQAIRMRETIEIDCLDLLQDAFNEDGLASLYEPYEGGYFSIGPFDPEQHIPLFQPGFDYSFISCDCDCPQPLDYENVSFTYDERIGTFISKSETDYSSITHPNHNAIDIKILNESQPWRCYDNNNKSPSAGTLIKFNDNVLNTNVTITTQDSLMINNSDLINDLQPGLYNIIKQFDDGSTEEQVIFKNGN